MKATDIKNELKELDYNVKDFKISVKHRGCADIYYQNVMYSFKTICKTVLLANAYIQDIDNELITDYNYTEEDLFELFV